MIVKDQSARNDALCQFDRSPSSASYPDTYFQRKRRSLVLLGRGVTEVIDLEC